MRRSSLYVVLVTIIFGFTALSSTRQRQPAPSIAANLSASDRPADGPAQEKAIRDVQGVFDQYIDGWRRADIEALSKVYAADARVTGIWPDPTLDYPVQGWPAVRRELERVFEYTHGMNMIYSPRHVEIYGDVAIMTTNWEWSDPDSTQSGSKEDPVMAEHRALMRQEGFAKGQGTFVFFHRGRNWVLVHEHASVLPPDK